MTIMTSIAEARSAGKYIDKVELIRNWLNSTDRMPDKYAPGAFGVSVPVFNEVIDLINDPNNWDDETIAGKVNWRKNKK